MSSKAEKIAKLIEMQKQFMEYEQTHGVEPRDYYAPESGHPLDGYRQQYRDLAMEVLEEAHKTVGSKAFS
ncbi:hypothetical protein [Thiohalophilus sp.]|uniref:hypothetical protein n=1 Tax=Thiohalophilus sp. TaxID=3028392 RepID=UPI002ACD8AC8|nr:hypothetical protein [Thiohalophilus sp.]MDZ7804466.1 hypothetical protein [Thiohalophilus sp.]